MYHFLLMLWMACQIVTMDLLFNIQNGDGTEGRSQLEPSDKILLGRGRKPNSLQGKCSSHCITFDAHKLKTIFKMRKALEFWFTGRKLLGNMNKCSESNFLNPEDVMKSLNQCPCLQDKTHGSTLVFEG